MEVLRLLIFDVRNNNDIIIRFDRNNAFTKIIKHYTTTSHRKKKYIFIKFY